MSRIAIGAFVLASIFWTTNGDVESGNRFYSKGAFAKALKAYKEAESDLPAKTYALNYNKGTVLTRLKSYQSAVIEFQKGCDVHDKSLRARCYFNLGTAYALWALEKEELVRSGKKKDKKLKEDKIDDARQMAKRLWRNAVDALEQALALDPKMADARHNLEVALLRVDPACEVRDDKYEDNGSYKQAKPLATKSEKWQSVDDLVLCSDDEDWYKVELKKAGRLQAEVKAKEGGTGKLSLELYAPNGTTRLSPKGETPGTEVELPNVPSSGHYLLRVRGIESAERDYTLKYRAIRPCSEKEDSFESNNTPQTAKLLSAKSYKKLMLCRDDLDWYRVELKRDEGLIARIKFSGDDGKLRLRAFDSTGTKALVTATAEEGGVYQLRLNNPGAGSYLLEVAGIDHAETPYELEVKVIPPCRQRDDKYEENDTPEQAKRLKPGIYKKLQVCKGDPDYFKIKLGATDSLFASVTFDPKEGKAPKLLLYKVNPLQSTIPKPIGLPTGNDRTRLVVLSTPGEGEYFVRISGEIGYTLALEKKPPCPKGDDAFEENDYPANATVLKKDGTILARVCPKDNDYFKVSVPANHQLSASIVFDHNAGDLDLSMLSDDGKGGTKTIGSSRKSSPKRPFEALVLKTETAKTVYLLVDGRKGASNFYLLDIKRKKLPPPKNDKKKNDKKKNDKKKNDKRDKKNDKRDKKNDKRDKKKDERDKDDKKKQPPKPKREKMTPRKMRDEMFKKKLESMKNKRNLEYEKALRQSPLRYENSRKNW
ncbi:MAG: PPC domain-containing protein [Myxococcales bacterium]|nr:PPC domain-containing protein [Myxococcales bacterium]